MIDYQTFLESEIRVGTVVDVNPLPKARKPAFVLTIDFGPEGTKKSSAQITDRYRPEQLEGKQVFAVTNLEPRQVGSVMSECLVLGVYASEKGDPEKGEPENTGPVVLAVPDRKVPNGRRLL